MFRAVHAARLTRRHFTLRTATLLLTAVVAFAGLWGVTHADDSGLTSSAPTPVSSSESVSDTHIVDAPVTTGATAMGVVTCILGLLCGLALATLLLLALRLGLKRLHQLRQRPAPIVFSSAFDHHGRHRFGLFNLGLLRI